MFAILSLVLTMILIWIWIRLRRNKITALERNGIPGPKPHLIFGNMFEGTDGLNIIEKQKNLIEKFGKIVGYYMGAKPHVLIADPELAKLIEIKDFNNFINRTPFAKYLHPSPKLDGTLVKSRDQKWKQIHSILSPAFSASKLKGMTSLVIQSVDSFIKVIENYSETDREFNIHDLYLKLSAEVIMKTAFGLSADLQNNSKNEFLRAGVEGHQERVNRYILMIFTCFPEFAPIIHWIRSLSDTIVLKCGVTPIGVLWKMSGQLINLRKQSTGHKHKDLLQAMLDSRITIESNQLEKQDNHPAKVVRNQITICLTEDEIRSNCLLFFGAGYENTSTGLSYVTHFLINYPDVQEKVRQEVMDLYEKEGELNYKTITGLQYMEWVLNETFRLYPPTVTGSSRECLADYKYKNMVIPEGTIVVIATDYLHHDPDYWTEPNIFDPMRFSPENRHNIHPSSWQPFGNGPRNCIGMRFAYLEMKLTLAKLLLNYRLEKGASSQVGELKIKYKTFTTNPKNGVFIKLSKL